MRQSHRRVTCGHDRIAIKSEERHGGREHARALVLALVQKLARRLTRRPDATPLSPRCGVVIIARSVVSIGRFGSDRKLATPAKRLVRLRRRGRAGWRRPAASGWSSPSDFAARARLRDRPARPRCSGRRAPPIRRAAPRAEGCRRAERASVGSNSSTRPKRARQPAVSVQFSPLMSWTIAEPGQVSSVGTTRPTPLPLRVGAKHSTCSGPSWRR